MGRHSLEVRQRHTLAATAGSRSPPHRAAGSPSPGRPRGVGMSQTVPVAGAPARATRWRPWPWHRPNVRWNRRRHRCGPNWPDDAAYSTQQSSSAQRTPPSHYISGKMSKAFVTTFITLAPSGGAQSFGSPRSAASFGSRGRRRDRLRAPSCSTTSWRPGAPGPLGTPKEWRATSPPGNAVSSVGGSKSTACAPTARSSRLNWRSLISNSASVATARRERSIRSSGNRRESWITELRLSELILQRSA